MTAAAARPNRGRLLLGALCAAAVAALALSGGAGLGGNNAAGDTVFGVGKPGEVQAAYLGDRQPVFVVHPFDGALQVLSAVDPGERGLVVWCADTRTFVRPGATSRWDEQGRYLFGPAASGLAPHAFTSDPNGATVSVGRRLPPRPVSDDPTPVSEEGACYTNGGTGGLRHDLAAIERARSPQEVDAQGTFTTVRGVLEVATDGGARLCGSSVPPAPCPSNSPTVTGTFHGRTALEQLRGRTSGEFLVRGAGQNTLDGLVDLSGALERLQLAAEATPYSPSDVIAQVVEVTEDDEELQLIINRPVRPRPTFPDDPMGPPPASRTWPLARDATIVSLTTQGQYPFADFLTVEELRELIAAEGPWPVEIHLDGNGVAVSLRPVAAEPGS